MARSAWMHGSGPRCRKGRDASIDPCAVELPSTARVRIPCKDRMKHRFSIHFPGQQCAEARIHSLRHCLLSHPVILFILSGLRCLYLQKPREDWILASARMTPGLGEDWILAFARMTPGLGKIGSARSQG